MELRTFEEVRELLKRYTPLPRSQAKVYTLETMRTLMQVLGNPQDTYKVIHVAGTSGKTSTSYYIAALLTAAGKKTGLTVSPHIEEVNERAQINMIPLEEQEYCTLFSEFMTIVQDNHIEATYFELVMAFAFWVFARKEVDYAVVEVGLGGLLDASNVITRADKLCVITDIGLDHVEVLGKTIGEIAAQKAGIVHPHNVVFTYEQSEEVMAVIREVTAQQQADLHEIWPLAPKELPKHLPLFQRRNWYLAFSVYEHLRLTQGIKKLTQKQLAETTETRIAGRMETLERAGKIVIVDGAHNAQKMEVLAESLREKYPHKTFAVLFGLVRSKNFRLRTSVESITELASHMIITTFDVDQDFRRVSVDPAKVAEHCHMIGFDDWEIVADPVVAYRTALGRPEDIIVIVGSFYMIDQLHDELYGLH